MSLSLAVITIALFLSPVGQSAMNSWLKNKFINDFELELSTGSLFVNPVGTTSFTDLLIRWFTDALIHSFTYSPSPFLTESLSHVITYSVIHSIHSIHPIR